MIRPRGRKEGRLKTKCRNAAARKAISASPFQTNACSSRLQWRQGGEKSSKSKSKKVGKSSSPEPSMITTKEREVMRASLYEAEQLTELAIRKLASRIPPPQEHVRDLPDLTTVLQKQRSWQASTARNQLAARIKSTQNVLLEEARKRDRPSWVLQLGLVQFVVDQFGFAEHTKWRSTVVELLNRILEQNKGDIAGPKQEHFKRLLRDINCYHRGAMLDELEHIADLTFAARSTTITHGLLPSSYPKDDTQSAMNVDFGQNITSLPICALPFPYSMEKSNNGKRRQRVSTFSTLDSRIVSAKLKLPFKIRNASVEKASDIITRLLVECSAHGAWRQSVSLFEETRKRGLSPTARMFHLVIQSLVRATPCQVSQADKLLLEAKSMKIILSLGVHNKVIFACSRNRPFAAWTRAAALFARLRSHELVANTATYTALLRVSQRSRAHDAPGIYEAFKLAGVPEYLAYACAEHCLTESSSRSRRVPAK